ncbi:zinc finger C-x8-C-x5-C-x3-H type, putative [Plasmodium knowlesi strain H]|uniref:Zinc finger C-x8-C-x5-C-x3-H type, putative n=3 Tax=Plasmodium knowlesi TaxID=5850 RepID=A0A5K1VTX7_PLAKH|nr:zinc finger (CCCH type) protein, putative [Plasmodium knowlesi strain H]OTN66043.1 putative Zinc finger C-x8-C-x5-C-x3-H type [Plasmodium knowlesi]CAA9987719.1 zinc finger (CCCH type) protein, putative [Plasmodium knowlesi strain H]SBO26942.1 zinc finger C-x8-C-x5-C-x3-H type, putative [Plasmodium knowlesi strain H]SBO29603.1 zinc finger C-x8-C-x5-C-x3-H type, putative [Plasmodium knowlesi strain H]VVS77193.1 zinc finger (CCCH type) protein, putative [Plasmodium knowlesi strain H]|eukprot:XP_002258717.1 hypothetical protein, conserved in Plasmodium species [Plasmodium knowlesi strain H]
MNKSAEKNSNRRMNQPADIKYQFTKTKICKHFLENRCMNKDNCNYAHVLEELRPLPNLENTKLCKSVKKKIPCCNPNCKYAHKIEKLQPSTDLATYKTTLCYFWRKKKCMNQDKCRFAHGIEEIRPLRISNEGKTETEFPALSDVHSSLGIQHHHQGNPTARRTNGEIISPGKKWGRKWGRNGGKMWRKDASRSGNMRQSKTWNEDIGNMWEARRDILRGNHGINLLEESSDSIWSNERALNGTTDRTNMPDDERTNQRYDFLFEEESVPDILSNIHLFENIPVMENGLFKLNDNFLNICNGVNLDIDALYTPPGKNYSSDYAKKESEENNIGENSILDMNFLNLDYLNDEDEVSEHELFRGNGLDINLQNHQTLNMTVNHDSYMNGSYDAKMWSEEEMVNRNYGISEGRHPEITQSSNNNVFSDTSRNACENIRVKDSSGNNQQKKDRNDGTISNESNIFNSESIEDLFSFGATSSEQLFSDSEFFAKWCKSMEDTDSKNFNNLCLF